MVGHFRNFNLFFLPSNGFKYLAITDDRPLFATVYLYIYISIRDEKAPAFDRIVGFSYYFCLSIFHKIDLKKDSVVSFCLFYSFEALLQNRHTTVQNCKSEW